MNKKPIEYATLTINPAENIFEGVRIIRRHGTGAMVGMVRIERPSGVRVSVQPESLTYRPAK